MDRLIEEEDRLKLTQLVRRLEEDMPSGSIGAAYNPPPAPYTPAVGIFYHFITRVWKVTGFTQQLGYNGENEFFVTLTEATDRENYPVSTQVFRVSEEEYDRFDMGDLIRIGLSVEPGI